MSSKSSTLAGLLALAMASSVVAQSPAPKKVYTNRLTFSLPVRIDDRDKAELRELRFCVKIFDGNQPGEWQCVETAPPTKNRFQYQAPQDGEYWFAFVTVDRMGRVSPADLDREPPGLMVVVDTKAPDVEVQKLTVASGETYLQCQIRDANADYSKIKLEAVMSDKSIRLLEPVPDTPGIFRIPDPSVLRGMVRATTIDKAGNRAVREVDLSPGAPQPPALIAAAPATPAMPTPAAPPPPAQPMVVPVSAQAMARPIERVETAPPPMLPPPGRQLVNGTHCTLDYAVDSGNVARVEAYATRDGGRTWMRVGEDPDRRSPIEFDLAEDGVYGVTLVVSTPQRPGTAPASGDNPDCWIEVDTTKPVVNVTDIRAGTGDDTGHLLLTWSAQDRNLAADPVEILIAAQPEGPWSPVARAQKPEGSTKLALPRDIGWHIFVRVEARDLAGNCGRWETREAIALDGGKPKVRVLGVNAGGRK